MIAHKYQTIMSGLVVRWRFEGHDYPGRDTGNYDAEINASRDGVSICGCWPIMKDKQALEVEMTLTIARGVHHRILAGDPLDDIASAPVFGTPNLEPETLQQNLSIDNSDEPISRQARERDMDDD